MDAMKICPGCQKPLAPSAPDGLCPQCLIKAGLGTGMDMGPDSQTNGRQTRFVAPTINELVQPFPQLEILSFIGQGGMGAVYKARQKALDRIVALKILPPGIGQEPAFAERFTREAKALAKLNHPGIVTLYEFGHADGLFFFLMEFVDGVTLRQLLEAGRLSSREALAIVPQICDALQYAHDQGIVHRDIKPENILLDRQGRVKVADFGLAKLVGTEQEPSAAGGESSAAVVLTEAGKVMGTPQYMAPEQRAHPAEVDHRADIYSLGVVFYQMLTGELPARRIEPPSHTVRVDVRLDEVVLRALEKEPERRYQQVSQMKSAVETISQSGAPADLNSQPADRQTGSPFQSGQVREIYARMTEAEKQRMKKFGAAFGLWNAATFFLPFACVWFFPLPVPLNWIIATVVLLVGLAFYPLWWRQMANRLCDTEWAKQHGYNPATLRLFPFGLTGIMLLGVAALLILAVCWWQTYEPAGVWLPYLSASSIPEPTGELLFRVTEVSQHKQIVLVRIACEPALDQYRLLATDTGPGIELPEGATNGMPNVDCLIAPDSNQGIGKALAGANGFSGQPDYLIGFVVPDEQAAAGAVEQIRRFYLANSNGLTKGHDSLPLFSLRRRLGNDAEGKPVLEQVWCSFILAAKPTAESALTSNLSFGPTINRVIQSGETGTNLFLNLDTGRLLTPPKDICMLFKAEYGKRVSWEQESDPRARKMREWLRTSGANLMVSGEQPGLARLEMREGAAMRPQLTWTGRVGFDQIDPKVMAKQAEMFLKPLQTNNMMNIFPLQPSFDALSDTRLDTFLFLTRNETVGVLQILNNEESPHGVRVRYKLVQTASVPDAPALYTNCISEVRCEGQKATINAYLDDQHGLRLFIGNEALRWTSSHTGSGFATATVEASDQINMANGSWGHGLVFLAWGNRHNIAMTPGGPVPYGEVVFRPNTRLTNENGTFTFADIRQTNGTLVPVSICVRPVPGKSAGSQNFEPTINQVIQSEETGTNLAGVEKNTGNNVTPHDKPAPTMTSLTAMAPTSTLPVAHEPATAVAPLGLSFGPTNNIVIQSGETGTNLFLNLDTGQLLTPPTDIGALFNAPYGQRVSWEIASDSRAQRMREWLRTSGANLMVSGAELWLARLEMREGEAMIHTAIGSWRVGFDETDPNVVARQAAGFLKSHPINNWTIRQLQPGFDEQANTRLDTFVFRTRKGTAGVLQILNTEDDPRGVRIRYKLVQTASVANASDSLDGFRAKEQWANAGAGTPEAALQTLLWAAREQALNRLEEMIYLPHDTTNDWRGSYTNEVPRVLGRVKQCSGITLDNVSYYTPEAAILEMTLDGIPAKRLAVSKFIRMIRVRNEWKCDYPHDTLVAFRTRDKYAGEP